MRNRIWIPELPTKTTEIGQFVNPVMTCKFGGEFIVELIEAKTGRIKERHQFPNLITDAGMNDIGARVNISSLFAYLGVGTDSTVPDVSDTTLGAEVDRTNSAGGFGATSGYVTGSHALDAPYWYQERIRLFLEGEGNGNLTELGWFQSSVGSTMIVRSLFKDGAGTPITVTKTSDDQLKVTYSWRMYPPLDIVTGSFILTHTATTHSFSASALNIIANRAWGNDHGNLVEMLNYYSSRACVSASGLVSPTGSVVDFNTAGAAVVADTDTVQAYSAGTFQLDLESIWDASSVPYVNIPGFFIRTDGYVFGSEWAWQLFVDPPIVKTNADQLKMNFRVKWDRAVLT